jgi:hypothetical protein
MSESNSNSITRVTVAEGTQRYHFKLGEESCWPVSMVQQSETYKSHLEDIPYTVIDHVEAKTGRPVVRR